MKKFFEKNDIIKMLLVVLLLVVVASWIMPASYFESGSPGRYADASGDNFYSER